jgi:hypothetical protein
MFFPRASLFASLLFFGLVCGPLEALTFIYNLGPAALSYDGETYPFTVKGKNLEATVPPSTITEKITLQVRDGAGWKPLEVKYAKPGKGNKVVFIKPKNIAQSDLRVVAGTTKFPAAYVAKNKAFSRLSSSASGRLQLSSNAAMDSVAGEGTSVPVTESDIWKVIGNQLFFFNQYRGLQVVDLTNSAAPLVTGTLRLPARGEQFYTLDETGSKLALLAEDQDNSGSSTPQSALYLVSVAQGVPVLTKKFLIEGNVTESRLIGNYLYVLTTGSFNSFGSGKLIGFDLSDSANATSFTVGTSIPGNNAILTAEGNHILVATSNFLVFNNGGTPNVSQGQGVVHVIETSPSTGLEVSRKILITKGHVRDSLNIDIRGDIVSVVSHVEAGANDETWVQTFPLSGTDTAALGSTEILGARGESLHATRFDGTKLYVVTFRNIDPLFVVDLANPATPTVLGTLEVPGWSTYIEPLGDRLLTVGVEAGQVAASLFDVANPVAPTLLSRVLLGNQNSWSEANWDKKAIGFFKEQGLLLLPYQSYDRGGLQNAVQIMSVGTNAITKQGIIAHDFTARRAAVHGNTLLSISGQELVQVGADDLVNPALLSELRLAWKVDRAIPFGDYLIQIEEGNHGSGFYGGFRLAYFPESGSKATLRITPKAEPDTILEEVSMADGPVVGATVKDGRLFVAQLISETDGPYTTLRTWVFDVRNAPNLPEITYTDHALDASYASQLSLSAVQALWPKEDTLVWYLPCENYYRWFGGPVLYDLTTIRLAAPQSPPASSDLALLCPIMVGSLVIPRPGVLVSDSITSTGSASKAHAANGFIFFSYDSEVLYVPKPVKPKKGGNGGDGNTSTTNSSGEFTIDSGQLTLPISVRDNSTGANAAPLPPTSLLQPTTKKQNSNNTDNAVTSSKVSQTTILPIDYTSYTTQSWLAVVDFRNPSSAVVRNRTSIPGQLLGVANVDYRGAMLFTNVDNAGTVADFTDSRRLQASAYDGVSAFEVATLETNSPYWAASASAADQVFLAKAGSAPGVVAYGFDLATSSIVQKGTLLTLEEPYEINVVQGYVLASSWGSLSIGQLATGADSITDLADFNTPQNVWLNVANAAVDGSAGLWLPAGDYGVEFLGFPELLP